MNLGTFTNPKKNSFSVNLVLDRPLWLVYQCYDLQISVNWSNNQSRKDRFFFSHYDWNLNAISSSANSIQEIPGFLAESEHIV